MKASLSILVTLLGIATEIKVQLQNALSPILITPSGIIVLTQPFINVFVEVSIIALQ